jgi:hypothetical protein
MVRIAWAPVSISSAVGWHAVVAGWGSAETEEGVPLSLRPEADPSSLCAWAALSSSCTRVDVPLVVSLSVMSAPCYRSLVSRQLFLSALLRNYVPKKIPARPLER